MLKKLVKYELKSILKFLSIFYLLSIFFALTTCILYKLNQTVFIIILSKISLGCLIAFIINILINNIMRCFHRFRANLYLDESYLTHTLPVTKKQLYLSKFIVGLITLIISTLIIILSLFIAFYSKENMDILREFLRASLSLENINLVKIVIELIIILFLEFLTLIQTGYIGIILGHQKNNNKIVHSVINGFIYYTLIQLFIIVSILIIGIFNQDLMSIFTTSKMDINILNILIWITIFDYFIINLISIIIGTKLLKKGVNVN